MIELEEALSRVLAQCRRQITTSVPVVEAVGYTLAEDVVSDVDSPPHDKSLVDGYAVRMDDIKIGRELEVLEEIVAGALPTQAVQPGKTSHVMTGAPVPEGTEAVIMVEQTERLHETGCAIRILDQQLQPGQSVMAQAASFARDEVVLSAGTFLRPVEVGLLCEVGRSVVQCYARPRVAILPTGDELVPASMRPGPGQIRNSNGPMLEACVRRTGCEVMSLGVGRDEETQLRGQIRKGLQHDVLALSGGVSAGTRDLVPHVLKSLGVEEIFHKVRLKPGKPLWFGLGPREDDSHRTLVFGLPGNPVSSLVCFQLFVHPALMALCKRKVERHVRQAVLRMAFTQRGNRPTFFPGRTVHCDGQLEVTPLRWHGSSDIRSLTDANCLIFFPTGQQEYHVGAQVDLYPFA